MGWRTHCPRNFRLPIPSEAPLRPPTERRVCVVTVNWRRSESDMRLGSRRERQERQKFSWKEPLRLNNYIVGSVGNLPVEPTPSYKFIVWGRLYNSTQLSLVFSWWCPRSLKPGVHTSDCACLRPNSTVANKPVHDGARNCNDAIQTWRFFQASDRLGHCLRAHQPGRSYSSKCIIPGCDNKITTLNKMQCTPFATKKALAEVRWWRIIYG